MAFFPAVCPQCAGQLQVPDDRDIVKCMYCSTDIVVRQAIRLVQGNTENLLEIAEIARMSGNHAEAISYYNKILENDPKSSSAWFGKAVSVGWSGTLADFRFQEMLVAFRNAINYATPEKDGELTKDIAKELSSVAGACYHVSRNHLMEFVALKNSPGEYLLRIQMIAEVLEVAHNYDPANQEIIEKIINILKENIEGFLYNDPYDNNSAKVFRFTDSSTSELRKQMDIYSEKLKIINPSYTPPEIKRHSAGCFVVTATFGNESHPTVIFLRSFRDNELEATRIGRRLSGIYYKHGPAFARLIEGSPIRQRASYWLIVQPCVLLVCIYKKVCNTKIRI